MSKCYALYIQGDDFSVGILSDGTIEYGGNYTPEAAARDLWEAFANILKSIEAPVGSNHEKTS